MLKNNFVFLVCFFLIVFTNATPFRHGCITTFEEEDNHSAEEFAVNTLTETISDCSNENDILQIIYINLSPDPPLKGKQLKINALGWLKEEIEEGSYVDVVVKLGLIKLLQKRFDLCEESRKVDKPCPIDKGRQELNTVIDLPKEIPPGKYVVDAKVYTPDSRRIACLKAVVIFRP
ncbi:ML domain-containing protein [Glomus cerebriforme]|uniref:Phosphatidylglycerol/phosphatidylinositol transfer protein n=1 Tax=Glomus cerebriforme TaxID=658196 RepID=A0A397SLQ9_9GLOM|nr:ML domain-containing protein [Glomus cerebriforme]